MTWTLAPHDNPRLRRRSARAGTGQVYYGEQLRRVLAPEITDPSLIERAVDYYWSHAWIARAAVGVGIVIAAGTLAAWIVG